MEGREPYLGWPDVAEMFGCGRSRAMPIMHEAGVVHVGRSAFVRASDLDAYLADHGGIDVTWPRETLRRRLPRPHAPEGVRRREREFDEWWEAKKNEWNELFVGLQKLGKPRAGLSEGGDEIKAAC